MNTEITPHVADAVLEGLKNDKVLTAKDHENREVNKSIRQLKGLWNPDLEQTPDIVSDRNDVLCTIAQVAVHLDIDHQEIADWIYGPDKVKIEEYLSELWETTTFTAEYPEFYIVESGKKNEYLLPPRNVLVREPNDTNQIDDDFYDISKEKNSEKRKLALRVNDQYTIFALYESNSLGTKLVLEVKCRDHSQKDIYKLYTLDNRYHITFEEAVEFVRGKIAELRETPTFVVTDLKDLPETKSGNGRGGKGILDTSPDPDTTDEGERHTFDFSELAEKIRNSSDKEWIKGQISQMFSLDDSDHELLFNAAMENKKINWSSEELFAYYGKTSLTILINAASDKNEFVVYLAKNIASKYNAEIQLTRSRFEDLLSEIPEPYRTLFIDTFNKQRNDGGP
jgi:hypothetical protein